MQNAECRTQNGYAPVVMRCTCGDEMQPVADDMHGRGRDDMQLRIICFCGAKNKKE